jgi:HSP20 family molecular chaperone IbpA
MKVDINLREGVVTISGTISDKEVYTYLKNKWRFKKYNRYIFPCYYNKDGKFIWKSNYKLIRIV